MSESNDPRVLAWEASQNEHRRMLMSDELLDALALAGVIQRDEKVRRVVIDAQVDEPVTMYLERYGDRRMLSIRTTLEGVEVRKVNVEDDDEGELEGIEDSEWSDPELVDPEVHSPMSKLYRPGIDPCPFCGAVPHEEHDVVHSVECPLGKMHAAFEQGSDR